MQSGSRLSAVPMMATVQWSRRVDNPCFLWCRSYALSCGFPLDIVLLSPGYAHAVNVCSEPETAGTP